ncbi:hypothetical protein [Azorhizobium oxalatiphilum]|uniref:hypothetical protein n=1 Tax=Azorhizobium oxalatiphilum TaxID=980631 RepID=UPI0016692C88|nr:hypothetical protein [Azorhizobium oxalatiphilum]
MTLPVDDPRTRYEARLAPPSWPARRQLLRAGVTGLLKGVFPLISIAAAVALLLAVLALVIGIELATGMFGFSEWIGRINSLKLMAAVAIYLVVYVLAMWNLAEAVGRLRHERDALNQLDRQITVKIAPALTSGRLTRTPDPQVLFAGGRETAAGTLDNTATYRLTEIIYHDASQHRFDPVSFVVERVADMVLGGSHAIRDKQTLAIRLGILATFAGIVMSLQGVSGIMTGGALNDAQIRGSIQEIVSSLGAAFSSSIAGLSAAILFQILGGLVRTSENRIIEALYSLGTDYQGICRQMQVSEGLMALEQRLQEHNTEIRTTSADMVSATQSIQDTAARVAGFLAAPVQHLDLVADRLDTALQRQDAALAGLAQSAQAFTTLGTELAHAQQQTATLLAQTLTDLRQHLVQEFRSGYDSAAAARMQATAERQYVLVRSMARAFLVTMVLSGVTLMVVILAATGWGARIAAAVGL